MPDLSAYLSCTISLDFHQGKLLLNDTSNYPAGVANNIKGIITSVQPDLVTRQGDWNAPDIIFSGSLTQGQIELRRQANNQPQQGTYIVTYQVDHPSYSPTTIQKTFIFQYQPITQVVTQNFDVFTPSLRVSDDSSYNVGGFNNPTLVRTWTGQIGSVGSVSGSNQILDLLFNTHYWDAAYTITLQADLTYQHSVYTFLSVVDRITLVTSTQANTPPGFPTLQTYLKTIKARYDALLTVGSSPAREDFEYSATLLEHIRNRICSGDTLNLYPQIQSFLNVYYQYATVAYVNTNAIIPTYDLTSCNCGSNVGTTDSRISNTDIANWNTAYNAIPPADLEYKIGTTVGAPTAGLTTFQLGGLVNRRIRLIRGKLPQPTSDPGVGEPYYSKPLASDTITLFNDSWASGEYVQIQFY